MHGFLNLDKPSGMTSRDVVNAISRLIRKTKVGHAGTLDPLATGVLVVCVGGATRLVERVQEHAKSYRAGFRLGLRSDTEDITGDVVSGGDASQVTRDMVEAELPALVGEIWQIPPRFSAIHVDGQRAYDKARAQQDFTLAPRPVRIDELQLTALERSDGELLVSCGSGTYIRALIRDLGERLGCGAVMTTLRRTRIGPFLETDAIALDSLTTETIARHLLPMITVIDREVRYQASAAECAALLQGKSLTLSASLPIVGGDGQVAVLNPTGELFALARTDHEGCSLQPEKVFPC